MKYIRQGLAIMLIAGLAAGCASAESSSSEEIAEIREGDQLSIKVVIAPQQERLKELGYYPIQNPTWADTVKKKKAITVEQVAAFNLMAQQAGLPYTRGVETRQAQMLLNSSDVQKTIFPTIVPSHYMNEDEPYTLKTVREDKKCYFYGQIKKLQENNGKLVIDVEAEEGFAIKATYTVPARSPDFLVGDQIIVFGMCTEKTTESGLRIDADLVAFAL